MSELRIAIAGFGKIARTRHVPAISAVPGAELVAIADPVPAAADVPQFPSLETLLREGPEIDAVALCTPPQARSAQAKIALDAGKHVLLEKPPGATASEIAPLLAAAREKGRTLFATWHSRFAPAVEPMRRLLAERRIEAVTITWKEDVRVWHPGQAWIFEAGGFGVYDPGINALSILTRILPQPLFVTRAEHDVPGNREAPIAAELWLADAARLPIRASFDFRQTGPQTWDIRVDTDRGAVLLSSGGARLIDGDRMLIDSEKQEYPQLYRRFIELAAQNACDVDLAPLQLVADAFLLSRRRSVEAFEDHS
ncbi:MAG: Gfo/Idh/MocA family oxidoreductase [Bradyrhizobium sp.]|uniref:Gfo/Idh/MocA family protein n=1 Tax=Bradyrhizobium sp. TaxID=376 RepID=UPI001D5F8C8E|nr:Gfo/Idh/MocA family oxidoreductase [Bradyrhizobium sp.]MBV9563751.1 Gfo/Idh/MocA family oxidoreductase [Bradyrhizobium sp.]